MKKKKRSGRLKIGSALAVLATEEGHSLKQALAERKELQNGIHDARRACRRLRSMLAFFEHSAEAQQAEALDHVLRELVHGFAEVRDAHMADHTARLLADSHAAILTPAVIDLLETRARVLLEAAQEQDPEWRQRRNKVEHVVAAIQALNWHGISAASAKDVLRHNVKRMKKTRRTALEKHTDETFHRWRRRARQVRYQLQALRKARRATDMKKSYTKEYGARIKQLGLITDRLGWRQDFQVFVSTLEQLPPTPEVLTLREALAKKSIAIAKASPIKTRNESTTDDFSAH
jgi:CHAD domain-containing protein